MSKLDEILDGAGIPIMYRDRVKSEIKSLIRDVDPDLLDDIIYFWTDNIYNAHSNGEKKQLSEDRIDEYYERVKAL